MTTHTTPFDPVRSAANHRSTALYRAAEERLWAAGAAMEVRRGALSWAPDTKGRFRIWAGGRTALECAIADKVRHLGDLEALERAAIEAADQAVLTLAAELGGEAR